MRPAYPKRMQELVIKFGDAARVQEVDSQACNCTPHTILLSLLTPLANKRTDCYGSGSLEDRARLLVERASVRDAVGVIFLW